MVSRSIFVALLAIGVSAGQTAGQSTLAGRIVDEQGVGVAAARVAIPSLNRWTIASADGAFTLRDLAPGPHVLLVNQIGFAPARREVELPGDTGTVRISVTLQRTAVTLAGIQVTATPTARDPLAIAQPTTTLAGRELQRNIGSTLGATLARQPGISARYDGPGANAPIIRGLSGDRILVLQDGQRTGDLSSTAPDHGVTIDPAAAHRVEIVRGPAALLYGNNALGGVVNVISEDIPGVLPSRIHGSVTMTAESATPGGGAQAELTSPVGRRAVVGVRVGARSHDDVRLGDGWIAPKLENTHLRNIHGVIGAALIDGARSVGGAYRAYGFTYGLPFPPGGGASQVHLEGARHELLARATLPARGWGGGVAGAEQIRLEGSAQWYSHDEIGADGAVATALALRSQTAQVVVRTGPLAIFQDGAFGVAALFRQNNVTGAQALTPANDSRCFRIFAFQEIPLFRLRAGGSGHGEGEGEGEGDYTPSTTGFVLLPLGIRYDRYAVESDASERFGPPRTRGFGGVSGSMGLTVPLAQGTSLGISAARAFRSPTPEELFSQAGHAGTGAFEIGDPDLKAEVNTGFDVVLRVERRGLTAQLAGYLSRIDGYIGMYPAGRDTVVSDGAGRTKTHPLVIASQRPARLRGAEGSLEAVVAGRLVAGLMGDVVSARDASGAALPFIPPARLGVSARFDTGFLSIGANVRHAFAQRRVPPGEVRTGAHTITDLHASLRVVRGSRVHSLTVRADNAADVLYRDAASRIKDFAPNPGRNLAAVYRVDF